MLHLASLFVADEPLPPVVSFAMGTLGFLTPFDVTDFADTLSRVWNANEAPVFCTLRTRKCCEVFWCAPVPNGAGSLVGVQRQQPVRPGVRPSVRPRFPRLYSFRILIPLKPVELSTYRSMVESSLWASVEGGEGAEAKLQGCPRSCRSGWSIGSIYVQCHSRHAHPALFVELATLAIALAPDLVI